VLLLPLATMTALEHGYCSAEEVGHLLILIMRSSLIGLGYCTIKASLAFAMTGPGFESCYEWTRTPLSKSQEGLSVEIWKSISNGPRYFI